MHPRSSKQTTHCRQRRESWLAKISFNEVIQFIYPSPLLLTFLKLSDGIEVFLTIIKAGVEHCSPCKVSSSKSGTFSLSDKCSFSHGTLIGLLVVAIATVRRSFLQKVVVVSYPGLKKKMVANGNKHQLNILPSFKMNIHRHKIISNNINGIYQQQKKNKRYINWRKQLGMNSNSLLIIIISRFIKCIGDCLRL